MSLLYRCTPCQALCGPIWCFWFDSSPLCRTAEALDDKRRSSLEAGSASDGNMSQQSDGSQCDLKAYTSVRRSQPRQPPPRAASLPDCLWYLPMQRSQQQQEQQQQPDQQHDLTSQRRSFSSDEGSDMDADCCGDSGAPPLLCPSAVMLLAIARADLFLALFCWGVAKTGSLLPCRSHQHQVWR